MNNFQINSPNSFQHRTNGFGNGFQQQGFGTGFGSFGGGFSAQTAVNQQLTIAMLNIIMMLLQMLQSPNQQSQQGSSNSQSGQSNNNNATDDSTNDNGQQQNNSQENTPDFRSIDGTGNNLQNPNLGTAGTAMISILGHDHSRGLEHVDGAAMPNVREISNAVADQAGQDTANAKGLSDMFWLWGQFLDHDITLTPDNKSAKANIEIPMGDEFYDPNRTGTATMGFSRSETKVDENGNEVHVNNITPYIDGSNIYGSDEETMSALRSYEGGKLRTSEGNLLPSDEKGMFKAGDVRANENAGLTSMHTLWVREHNRIADQLACQYPQWNDERIFQEARREVIAELQAITYNEFVPGLLGENGLDKYEGYDANVSPQMSHAFSVAAFRLGHTMISPTIHRIDEDGNEIEQGHLSLREAFFKPDNVRDAGIDPILRGMAASTAQAIDPMVIDDLRNFLFGAPGDGGHDLVALNIQRGRDHEMPSLNDAREQLGLSRIESFDDPIWKDDFGQKLAQVYSSPDEVDLWIGGLAEAETGDSLVGDTFTLILKDQFERMRDGDRYWYENEFSENQINDFNNLTLADIIRRNTDIQNIQDNVMVASGNIR